MRGKKDKYQARPAQAPKQRRGSRGTGKGVSDQPDRRGDVHPLRSRMGIEVHDHGTEQTTSKGNEMRDNSTGKTVGFYERGQAIFDRIPKEEKKMKMSPAEAEKLLADRPRVKPAPAKAIENWYYLDETHQLHQLSKNKTFDDAWAEMEIAATVRGVPFLILVCEDNARNWRACLDRWLGNDKFPQKYKKRKEDL